MTVIDELSLFGMSVCFNVSNCRCFDRRDCLSRLPSVDRLKSRFQLLHSLRRSVPVDCATIDSPLISQYATLTEQNEKHLFVLVEGPEQWSHPIQRSFSSISNWWKTMATCHFNSNKSFDEQQTTFSLIKPEDCSARLSISLVFTEHWQGLRLSHRFQFRLLSLLKAKSKWSRLFFPCQIDSSI